MRANPSLERALRRHDTGPLSSNLSRHQFRPPTSARVEVDTETDYRVLLHAVAGDHRFPEPSVGRLAQDDGRRIGQGDVLRRAAYRLHGRTSGIHAAHRPIEFGSIALRANLAITAFVVRHRGVIAAVRRRLGALPHVPRARCCRSRRSRLLTRAPSTPKPGASTGAWAPCRSRCSRCCGGQTCPCCSWSSAWDARTVRPDTSLHPTRCGQRRKSGAEARELSLQPGFAPLARALRPQLVPTGGTQGAWLDRQEQVHTWSARCTGCHPD